LFSDVGLYFYRKAQAVFLKEIHSPSCGKQVQLGKPLCNLPSRMPHIIQRSIEEIFPGLRERLVSVLCRNNCNISFINAVADVWDVSCT
jgi:hypothetical protein